eukprot:TRINITY_DN5413_c0_g1_i1.p1 TRINITY_DN5413_c0_g1~~TRINITY_DN5413_c0_g1_i1.p1  ORF type:complete len:170 (-),score=20.06 TRINITY_DN5413_c0_g1_i1:41-520(-)
MEDDTMEMPRISRAPKLNFIDEELGFWDHILAFVQAIDWTEPFIQGLLVFHISLFFFIILNRKNIQVLSVVFFGILAMVFFAENLNTWCSQNYKEFSEQNYFDKTGTFISFLYSLPLIANDLIILICFVRIMGSLLIKVKRAELKEKRERETKQGKKKE